MYEIGSEELSELEELFKKKKFFRYQGKDVATNCSLFEKEFSQYLGMKHSLFVTSGTNALFLALKSLGIGEGDEVIVPSYTFIATITAVLHVGATPVVASIGQGLTLDANLIESKITSKTKAIIPVHMDGYPSDMDAILSLAEKNGLFIIEDVAQAVGGEYKGKKLGSFGHASCFSFNVDKIISCGEGGLVAFKEEAPFKKALMLHDAPVSFGMTYKDYLSDIPREAGYSMRMSEISAVIMRKQLSRLDHIILQLRIQKKLLVSHLAVISDKLLEVSDPSGDCSTHLHLKCSDPLQASEFAKVLTEGGVLATPLYARPVHCYWHWQGLLKDGVKDLGRDRIHLSSILRIAIDYESNHEEVIQKAMKISTTFKDLSE
jgi:8-amino-3,8-dideoxy-alpha-D-manno-octulosonate transaminase